MENVLDLLQVGEVYHQTLNQVVQDIISILKEKNVEIDEPFAVMMIKIVSLDPANNFLIKQPIERMEVERLKKVVVERILCMTSATRNVIRMQLFYRANYFAREQVVKAREMDNENRIRSSLDEMTQTIPKHLRHYDLYYERLIVATIIKAGLGPQSERQVIKETHAALEIIFPKEDIDLLRIMSIESREYELRHFMKMAAGIRLYNWELDPENLGAGIHDLPKLIPDKISGILNRLHDIRERNIRRLIVYTTLTQPYFLDEEGTTNKFGRRELWEPMIQIRHGLIMIHQLLIYLRQLADNISNEQRLSSERIEKFKEAMNDLKSVLSEKELVATFVIYPKFETLANIWEGLQDSILYTESCERLLTSLEEFSELDLTDIDPIVIESTDLDQMPTEEEFFNFPEYEIRRDSLALAERVPFTMDVDPLETQYSGFCTWSLVKGYGLLVLSNPNIGVYNWKGKAYLFATPEGGEEFAKSPDKYIYNVLTIARRWPQLIFILKLEHDVFDPDLVQNADRATTPVDAKIWSDFSMQTELHPLESNIAHGYTWNEWELRKQAITLSKIHKCATHSTQTHWQALKKTQEVQTYPSRNRRTQTNQSKYAEAPRNQFHFYGLLGLHGYPPHIVDLTREPVTSMKCHVKNLSKLEKQLALAAREAEVGQDKSRRQDFRIRTKKRD